MLNESTYRSPKFLRSLIDFEINTGSDVKGDPSKRKINQLWKERWSKVDQSLFIEFYKKTFPEEEIFYRSDLDDIYKRWKGNFHLWDLYDKWIEEREKKRKDEEREKKRREEEIEKEEQRKRKEYDKTVQELNSLYSKILNDFRLYPYSDKFSTPKENDKVTFHYKFENGDTFSIRNNEITYNSNGFRHTYTVGTSFSNKFINLANLIIKNCLSQRPGQKSSHSNSANPKSELYQRLKKTIELRKSQLDKMPKNHPDRKTLENELDASQRALDNLKSKYKFESLIGFYDFKY